jgi:hypothetical protein
MTAKNAIPGNKTQMEIGWSLENGFAFNESVIPVDGSVSTRK